VSSTPSSKAPPPEAIEPVDALVAAEPPQPSPPPSPPEQQPRGHRRRRTTLPRSTRGWSRGIVWSLIGLTSFGIIYGLIARIETSVNATGKLRPAGGVTTITAPFTAPVSRVLVKENQVVHPGQPLIELRDKALRDQRAQLETQRQFWLSQTNLLALRLGLPALPPDSAGARRQLEVEQREVMLRQKAAVQEQKRSLINLQQQMSDLVALRRKQQIEDNITARTVRLVNVGAMAQLELDRQAERMAELRGTIARTEKELESARHRIKESQLKQQQIPAAEQKQLYSQYNNAKLQYLAVAGSIDDLKDRLLLARMLAPVAGRVFNLNAKRGETLTPGRMALQIVPFSRLDVGLSISNRDIGFLEVGMPVEVRVTSFPFTDYGALKGTIARIGADSQPPDQENPQESFPLLVKIQSSELSRKGRIYKLRPGMAVTALIQLGSRPVISLISDRFGGFMESTRSIR
jgi:HlyD family secretion protein